MNANWPKHPNGKNKKLGEMTKEEQKKALRPSMENLKEEIESAPVKKILNEFLK